MTGTRLFDIEYIISNILHLIFYIITDFNHFDDLFFFYNILL